MGQLFTSLAYVAGALVFYLSARRRKTATEGMAWVALWGLVFGIIGARLTEWAVSHSATLASNPSLALNPETGGRTVIGGVIAGWIGVELAKWRLGIRRSTGDLFALAVAGGEVCGRM